MKKIVKICLMFVFIILTYNVISKAAISATSKTVNSGENVSIVVTSNVPLSAYTVSVTSYNGLTFLTSSGGSGAGTTSISDAKATGGMSTLATFQFRVPTVNKDQTFQVNFSASGMGDVNLNPVQNSSCSANIIVKAKNQTNQSNPSTDSNVGQTSTPEKSKIATLSNLGIKPNDFSGFRADTYSYNVEVPNNLESIEIYASKGHKGQTISGIGRKILKEGKNAFNVVVTAEDGKTQKTYSINVVRQQKEGEELPEEDNNTEENPMDEVFGLSELKIAGINLEPEFQTDVYEYRVELKEDIDKLDITTIEKEIGSNIEITGNENLQEGENVITILVKGDNEAKTTAYQIVVNKILEDKQEMIDEEENNQEEIKEIVIISVAGVIIFIIILVAIIVKLRKSKKLDNDYIPYQNVIDTYDEDENDKIEEIIEEENYKENNKKKKRSKGKRFK